MCIVIMRFPKSCCKRDACAVIMSYVMWFLLDAGAMVQSHFWKVTLLSSTNLYEVLENVEHKKRLPVYKR